MTNVGSAFSVVLIATAVTSGKRNVIILKDEVSRMWLLMYIVLRGLRFGKEADSTRVQDPCTGADSVMFDRYCSCIISIVNLFELGSIRMLCVRDELFLRLYCRIAMVLTLLFSVILSNGLLLDFQCSYSIPLCIAFSALFVPCWV